MRTLKHEGSGILVELNQVTTQDEEDLRVPEFLQDVLDEHKSVFRMPLGLPHVHGHEHSIVLKEGSPPISVRPYRYPYFQKAEIKQLIKEMLTVGII